MCGKLLRSLPLIVAAALAFPSAAQAEERDCRGAIGAETVDNLRVPNSVSCTLSATRVNGSITVETGATLRASAVVVVGNVQAQNAAVVVLTESTVGGSVQVKQGGGASIFNNTIDGNLQCKENSPAPVGGGNLVHGSAEDQCASFAGGPGASGRKRGGSGGDPVAPADPVGQRAPLLMNPFPVARIAGRASGRGARIRLLTVRAQPGATVRVSCRGRGCPFRRLSKTISARVRDRREPPPTRLVRIRNLEGRLLRPGATLRVFVTLPGAVGKYTRFGIRKGKIPLRTDMCLAPGSLRPVSCPSR